MLDTSTVNFAIGKMEAALGAVAPHVQNISAQYVEYCTFTAIMWAIVFVVLTLICIAGTVGFAKHSRETGEDWATACAWITGVVGTCFLIAAICCTGEAIMAAHYPEAYAIQKVICPRCE